MKKQMIKTLFVVLTITSLLLVGCGGKENVTDNNTETVTKTNVTEVETSTQEESNSQEAITETEAVAETETPTEEPTPEPTEEPTPTPEPVHEHSYTETIIVEGTCTTWGTKCYTCSCGDSYEKEYALDHVSDGNRVVTHEPTCSSEGASGEHCIYCGERMYGRSIPKTGHIPNSYWAYFPQSGNYYNSCSICNSVITVTTTRPEGVEIREATPIDSSTLQPIN